MDALLLLRPENARSIWGLLNEDEATVAAYWVRWTDAHLAKNVADFKLAIGPWGDGTTAEDRVAVELFYRLRGDGEWFVIVTDACDERLVDGDIASRGLRRDEVVGTPMAPIVFALFDAIYLQDERLFAELRGSLQRKRSRSRVRIVWFSHSSSLAAASSGGVAERANPPRSAFARPMTDRAG